MPLMAAEYWKCLQTPMGRVDWDILAQEGMLYQNVYYPGRLAAIKITSGIDCYLL